MPTEIYMAPTVTHYSALGPENIVADRGLDGIQDGVITAVSDIIQSGEDNLLKTMAAFYLHLEEQPSDRNDGGNVDLHILPVYTVDGKYVVGTYGEHTKQNTLARRGYLDKGKEARRIPFHHVILPNGKFVIALENNTGAPFAKSGNTIRAQYYSFTNV